MRKLLFALLLLCFGVSAAQAPGTGNYAFASFDNRGFDSVNLGNLNVRFTIPIVNRPGRGVPFSYVLQYEGLVWSVGTDTNGNPVWVSDPNFGLNGLLNGTGFKGYLTHASTPSSCVNQDGPANARPAHGIHLQNYTYHDQFGISHVFNYDYYGPCGGNEPYSTGDGTTSDNSGYALNLNDVTKVLTRDHATISPALSATGQDTSSYTDTNGNYISGGASGAFTDTFGVSALTISGSSPRNFTYPVTLQANNATSASTTLSYKSYTVRTNFQCSGVIDPGSNTVNLPDRVTYADNSFYAFTYEGTPGASDGAVTGRIASVTLPTGGVIQYAYSGGCNNTGLNPDGTVGNLSRTTSDSSNARTYNRYASSVSNSTYTVLTDEKGNQARYDFTIDAKYQRFFETHRRVYQGSMSGTPMLDQQTCYGSAAPCDTAPVTLPLTEVDVAVSYDGTPQVITKNSYDAATGTFLTKTQVTDSSGNVQMATSNAFDSNGNLQDVSQSDGGGTVYAHTHYGYDETAVTGTSGVPQHTAATSSRNNLTSTSVDTGSGSLTTSTTYYDTGQPYQSTAQNGGVTTYGYDGVQGFATTTSLPTPSSGIALGTGAQYDLNSAALTSYSGMNPSETTSVSQYDARMRPLSVTLPNTSTVTYAYPPSSSPVPFFVSSSQNLGAAGNAATYKLYDGYGRISRTAVDNGQGASHFYQVDYCYDDVGMLKYQSTTYQSTGWDKPARCSDPNQGTAYTYDALGRVLTETNYDGAAKSYTYLGRAVRQRDVNRVGTSTQYDMLGRVSIVCELSDTNYGDQTPSSCGTQFSGDSGYATIYGYNLAQHQTTITQGTQTRTFVTDAAGRPTSSTEPERGVTSYAYAYNSTGLNVTRTRPKANQFDPNTVAHTSTQYDLLNRIVNVSYDDGRTPGKSFYYETTPSNQNWTNTSIANTGGRLAAMSTTNNLRAQFSYDVSGNVTEMWQCTSSICGTDHQKDWPSLQYHYNPDGTLHDAFDAATLTLTYSRNIAGEVTGVTENLNDPNNPPTLVSNVVNGPFGIQTYSLANGLGVYWGYDSLGRINASNVCNGAAVVNCNPGVYGENNQWLGSRSTGNCDTMMTRCYSNQYDDLNRLTASNASNPQFNFSYSYDRYGNRLTGNGASYSVNSATNRQNGVSYDAAGNQLSDAQHSYTYDAEGNILLVDNGSTAGYAYDALNRRATFADAMAGVRYDSLFDPFGRMQSTYSNGTLEAGRIYWDHGLLAHRIGGKIYFHHTNYLGTERLRTNLQGTSVAQRVSGPFGEQYQHAEQDSLAGSDLAGYTGQDHDTFGSADSATDHFQYRQYSEVNGRWLSPDPYNGSYDSNTPQTSNRYSYALGSPYSYIDPLGLTSYKMGGDGCLYEGNTSIEMITADYWEATVTWTQSICGSSGSSSASGAGSGGGTVALGIPINPKRPKTCDEQLAELDRLVNAVRPVEQPKAEKGLAQRFRQMNNKGYDDEGHMEQIAGKQRQLQRAIKKYQGSDCGSPPSDAQEYAFRPIANPWPRLPTITPRTAVIIVTTGVVIGAIFCPECLIVAAPAAAF